MTYTSLMGSVIGFNSYRAKQESISDGISKVSVQDLAVLKYDVLALMRVLFVRDLSRNALMLLL